MRTIVVGHLLSVTLCVPIVYHTIHGLRKRNNAVDEKCSLYNTYYIMSTFYSLLYVDQRPTELALLLLLLRLLYEFYPFIIVHCTEYYLTSAYIAHPFYTHNPRLGLLTKIILLIQIETM